MQAADATARKIPTGPVSEKPQGGLRSATRTVPFVGTEAGLKRVALIGVGEAAQAHADAIKSLKNIRLEGIIDPDLERARTFAWRNGLAAAASLRDMLAVQTLDAVHILASAGARLELMGEALSSGLSILAESPLAQDFRGAEALVRATAATAPGTLAANHHFLFHPAFARLAEFAADRRYGPLLNVSATVALARPVPCFAAGQHPADILLAEAAHPLSQILSLTGPVLRWKVLAATPDALAIALTGREGDAQLSLRFGATYPVWEIAAFCADGILKADMLRNRFVCEERSKNSEILDNFLEARRLGRALLREARRNLMAYGRTFLGLGRPRDGVQQSLVNAIAAFHRRDLPSISTPQGAAQIVRLCEDIAAEAFPAPQVRARAASIAFRPQAVVLGGTGFLGRHIVKALADRGVKVAALSRSPANMDDDEHVRFLRGDVLDGKTLCRLTDGAAVLINASGLDAGSDWASRERRSQTMIANLIAACRLGGVHRLIHLSSVDALYLGDRDDVMTGRASADPHDWQRHPRARAKGLEEIALLTAFEESLLPVSILRPGIVVGEGGTPYPTAVGRFVNSRHCLGWGKGTNPLPFVLAEDVAAAVLAAAEKDAALGHCFNLVGDVRLTAREYVAALGAVLERPLVFHSRSSDRIYLTEKLRVGLRRRNAGDAFCSRRDLYSRAMLASFDCSDVKAALNWTPVADRETFIARGLAVHRAGTGITAI